MTNAKAISAVPLAALAALRDAIHSHDLTYSYSDDASVWRRGQASYDSIVAFARRLGCLDFAMRCWRNKCERELRFAGDIERWCWGFENALTSPTWK